MTIRTAFIKHFDLETAERIEDAAAEHRNRINGTDLGEDSFKWCLLICIGYECITEYRDYHQIKPSAAELQQWIIENADLGSHTGDCDYIALAAGAYQQYIKESI